MSQPRALGPAAGVAAALPVTGGNTVLLVMVGMAVLVAGLLLFRAGRAHRVQG